MSLGFTSALLMGGQSRRMGQDKAYLTAPGSDEPGWARQLRLLESLQPQHRFLSLREGQSAPSHNLLQTWKSVPDIAQDVGPIGGIAACLADLEDEVLLVLAIDLLAMGMAPLRHLLDQAKQGCGAIYLHERFYEPLAAVYPKVAASNARDFLEGGGRRLQTWVQSGVEERWLQAIPLPRDHARHFANVNDASDFQALTESPNG